MVARRDEDRVHQLARRRTRTARQDSNLYVVDAKAGAVPKQLTTFVGPDGGRPAWSPDGQWIAYVQGDEPRLSAYQLEKLAIVPAAGGEPKILTAALDRAVNGPLFWSADGKSLYFTVERRPHRVRRPHARQRAAPWRS